MPRYPSTRDCLCTCATASLWGVSQRTVERWAARGVIKARRPVANGPWLIHPAQPKPQTKRGQWIIRPRRTTEAQRLASKLRKTLTDATT